MEGNPKVVCKEEGTQATESDALLPLFRLACTPLTFSYLTLPLTLTQGRQSRVLCKHRSSSTTAVVHILVLGSQPAVPHLALVAVLRRVALTRRHGRGRPPGEPPCPPDPARVSGSFLGGGRKKMTWGHQSKLYRTAQGARYWFIPPQRLTGRPRSSGGLNRRLPRASSPAGPARCWPASAEQIWSVSIFFKRNLFNPFSSELQLVKSTKN
jgi:hypothetical protein